MLEWKIVRIGVLKEPANENRVSLVPESVKKLLKIGFEIVIETDAGRNSHNIDHDYLNA